MARTPVAAVAASAMRMPRAPRMRPWGLRLAGRGAAFERLERAQLVPGLLGRRGLVEAETSGLGLDDALADADVDRAPLDARRSTLAPEAQVALREDVLLRVVGDARTLRRCRIRGEVVHRERELARGEDAGLVAATACHAAVLVDEARARLRLDPQRVDRADVETLRGRALEARLLME